MWRPSRKYIRIFREYIMYEYILSFFWIEAFYLHHWAIWLGQFWHFLTVCYMYRNRIVYVLYFCYRQTIDKFATFCLLFRKLRKWGFFSAMCFGLRFDRKPRTQSSMFGTKNFSYSDVSVHIWTDLTTKNKHSFLTVFDCNLLPELLLNSKQFSELRT